VIKLVSWLWTDGKSGKFSGTTFRTWLAFLLFLSSVIYWVWFDTDGISSQEEIIIEIMAILSLGQGGLYGMKRFTEGRPNVAKRFKKMVQQSSESDSSDDNLRGRGL
jgi:hypothetical protein